MGDAGFDDLAQFGGVWKYPRPTLTAARSSLAS
jgi:hypothetical protein